MKPSRGVLSLLTVLILFSILGGGVVWRILAEPDETESTARDGLPSTDGVNVASAALFTGAQAVAGVAVIQDTLWIRVVAAGTAEAYRLSVVATRRAGVVERVLVRENDFVQAGDVLIQLDTLEAAMDLAEADANLRSSQTQLAVGMLAGGDIDDPAIRDERERNLRIQVGMIEAESRLRRAQLEMEFTRVTAPFSGRVADLAAVEGAYLPDGGDVLTLVQLNPIRVQAEVLESDLTYLTAGRRASVRFSAIPDAAFEASVESVNPIVDVETRSGRVTLVLPNPESRIKPGMYATVSLDAQSFPNRILIPREAVVERGQPRRQVVFMLRDADAQGQGVSEWRYVTTGRRNETQVEIIPSEETSMLEPGEIVLVNGHHYLAHDIPVRLVDNVRAAGGRPGG